MHLFRQHHRLRLCLFFAGLLFWALPVRSQSPAPDPIPECNSANFAKHSRLTGEDKAKDQYCSIGDLPLRWTSYDVAGDVCTSSGPQHQEACLPPLLKKLGTMTKQDRCGAKKIDELLLRQKISEMIMTASLEVDGFVAEVDSESNHLRELKDDLTDRQSKALIKSSGGSAVGTAGGGVGSALGIAAKTATAGSWVGAIFGGIGAAFGIVGWVQQKKDYQGCFPTKPGDKSCKDFDCPEDRTAVRSCSPTMLYYALNPPKQPFSDTDNLFHSTYDPVILSYLEDPADNRGQKLVNDWGPIEHREKLTANHNSPTKLSIENLADRQNKLADLRALVARINRDLSRLTEDLSIPLAQCSGDDGN
jgi:hypothetical protein